MTDLPPRELLDPLLSASAARHDHLCPRQVLGVRLGLFGLKKLGFIEIAYQTRFQNNEKRLLTIVETDGCGADGIAVATDCSIGHRTLRVMDYGKVAATFVDTHTGKAIRVAPRLDARSTAVCHSPNAPSRWHAYLTSYQEMTDESLFLIKKVQLLEPIEAILSTPDKRAVCDTCGEEIFNERETLSNGRTLCLPCANLNPYWRKVTVGK